MFSLLIHLIGYDSSDSKVFSDIEDSCDISDSIAGIVN